jgi:hypothetical protein
MHIITHPYITYRLEDPRPDHKHEEHMYWGSGDWSRPFKWSNLARQDVYKIADDNLGSNTELINHIRAILREGFEMRIVVVLESDSLEEVRACENEGILKDGRRDLNTGFLYNHRDSQAYYSPGGAEVRVGQNHPNFGKPSPFRNHHHSIESNDANRKAHLGKLATAEVRRRNSEAHTGSKNHMYGKHHAPETAQKISRVLLTVNRARRGDKCCKNCRWWISTCQVRGYVAEDGCKDFQSP